MGYKWDYKRYKQYRKTFFYRTKNNSLQIFDWSWDISKRPLRGESFAM